MLSAAILHSTQQGPGTNMGARRAMVCEAYTMSGTSQGWAVNMIRLQRRRTQTRERRVPVSSYPIPSCLCPCYVSYPITRVSAMYPVPSHVCLCYVPCPITPLHILCTGGFKWKKSKSVWNREATSSCCNKPQKIRAAAGSDVQS